MFMGIIVSEKIIMNNLIFNLSIGRKENLNE